MSATKTLRLTHLSEIDLLELKNAIAAEGIDAAGLVEIEADQVPSGAFGDFGLSAALITFGPSLITALASILAAWIAKGRKESSAQVKQITILKDGATLVVVPVSDLEVITSSNAIKSTLTDLLTKGKV